MQRGLRRARSDWVASMSDSISDGANGAVVWDSVKKLRDGLDGKPRPPAAKMKKADGSFASTPEENAVVFAEHFKSLYGREPSIDASVLNALPQRLVVTGADHAPTDIEIRTAVSKLNDTAPGDSGLKAPLWKALILTSEGSSPSSDSDGQRLLGVGGGTGRIGDGATRHTLYTATGANTMNTKMVHSKVHQQTNTQ